MKHTLAGAALLLSAAYPAHVHAKAWDNDDKAQLTEHIGDGRYQTVTSVLVMENGETLYEGYFRGATAATRHDTRSSTKTLIGMAAGAAIKDGKMTGPDQKLAPFFLDYEQTIASDSRKAAISAEDLLTMSSPVECNDWNEMSRGNEERMYITEDWTKFYWSLPIRGYPAWDLPPAKQPYGRTFSYCTAGVQLLGQAIARATGEPVTDYIKDRVFTPIGITGEEYSWQYNGLGEPHLGGGLLMTTHGLGKLGELGRLEGQAPGGQVFSTAWGAASLTPQADIDQQGWLYGYLWWLKSYEVGGQTVETAAMNGNGGNRVWIIPAHNMTVVLTKTDYNSRGMHEAAEKFLTDEILPRLTGTTAPEISAPEKD
ncbi:serine hydrolase domain-containing protein [Kordiimonas sp.]|uniref:serine hydrolase domain-containing protein n=1 Tax=Kordiimonas sp. TaxID=1970157 RepID=UPI003A934D54